MDQKPYSDELMDAQHHIKRWHPEISGVAPTVKRNVWEEPWLKLTPLQHLRKWKLIPDTRL